MLSLPFDLNGHAFIAEKDDEEGVFYVYPKKFVASLVGMGRSLAEAIADVGFEANILLGVMGQSWLRETDNRNPGAWDLFMDIRLQHLDPSGACRCSHCNF